MDLTQAILANNPQAVQNALNHSADANKIDDYGYTPLIEAGIVNNTEIAKLLLKHGANVNDKDLTGATALHWAVDNHNMDLVALLLEHGANPNAYTSYGQPLLIKPILREQKSLKRLLYKHGADLDFAQDYINAKLLGHRFELKGRVDIVDPGNTFIEIEYDGFFLEFTLDLISNSLIRYRNHYKAKDKRHTFPHLNLIIKAFSNARELLKYQHYLVKREEFKAQLQSAFNEKLLIIPLSYAGHAVGAIKYGNWLALCDRGERSQARQTVEIYELTDPALLNFEFLDFLYFEKLPKQYMEQHIYEHLKLRLITDLPIPPQTIGNCSWANVEAIVPTVLFMLSLKEQNKVIDIASCKQAALRFYEDWGMWDKNIALHECVTQFHYASEAAKASKATILASILFQTCRSDNQLDLSRASKIIPILQTPKYEYILQSFIDIYSQDPDNPRWQHVRQLLNLFDAI